MKKWIPLLLIALTAALSISGCTNNEGGEDLDVITPADSTQSKVNIKDHGSVPNR